MKGIFFLACIIQPVIGLSLLDSSTVWLLQGSSALLSYFGLVVALDRPRGELHVDVEAVEIRTSQVPGAGLGLFANQDLKAGTVLGAYPGVLLPLQQHSNKLRSLPECEAYIWRFSDNKFVIDPTNHKTGKLDEFCSGGNPGTPGSIWLYQMLRCSVPTYLCRINEPPLGKDVNVVTEEDLRKRTVCFQLERDVAQGEEFFIDYGLSYDRSRYGGV